MAIYQEISELDHDSIAGGKLTRDRMDGDQYDLAKDHQAFARRDFLQHLRLMAEQGTGSDFDCLRRDVISLDSETWVSMMKNLNADIERLMMIEMIRENKQTLGDSGLLAWNLLLRVSWCRRAYRAGYLSEDEFWRHVMPVARLLQKSFDSWETMGRNYLHGFQYSAPKDFYTTDTGRLRWLIFDRLLRDADSPWLQLPWDLDLSPPSANDEIEPID
ncbi:MAG: DUF1266 domain-containing protein, partial [Kiritimatiellia bacterium]|nr:DUF1266 domain-containing protein [Kiritimatiellia bacterium]